MGCFYSCLNFVCPCIFSKHLYLFTDETWRLKKRFSGFMRMNDKIQSIRDYEPLENYETITVIISKEEATRYKHLEGLQQRLGTSVIFILITPKLTVMQDENKIYKAPTVKVSLKSKVFISSSLKFCEDTLYETVQECSNTGEATYFDNNVASWHTLAKSESVDCVLVFCHADGRWNDSAFKTTDKLKEIYGSKLLLYLVQSHKASSLTFSANVQFRRKFNYLIQSSPPYDKYLEDEEIVKSAIRDDLLEFDKKQMHSLL